MSYVPLKSSDCATAANDRPTVLPDLARESAKRAANLARNLSFRTWPYRLSLAGPLPDRILCYPADLHQRSTRTAQDLGNHIYALPGGIVHADPTTPPWRLVPPNEAWAEALHGFGWIRHFETRNDEASTQHVHWLIETWLKECGRWHSIGWRPHVIGRRLISWFSHSRLILRDSDLIWRSTILRSLIHQSRHLARVAKWARDGEPKLVAAIGLSLSGLCLPEGDGRRERGLALLMRELNRQILPDGGHVSRNPSLQLSLMLDLLMLKDALVERNQPVPQDFEDTISRMAPLLRFFRLGDGRLALFNGSQEEEGGAIDAVLSRPDTKAKAFGTAPYSGYQRLKAGRTCLIMDTGPAPARAFSCRAHAGCLSFEMSVSRHRLIVNCGSTALRGSDWQTASRATAAHSTLTLADKSSATILKRPWAKALLGPRLAEGPITVTCQRDENEQGIWLGSRHDGYCRRFGLYHERRLYLDREGGDLRGEDSLVPVRRHKAGRRTAGSVVPFTIRFHLHPDVRASQSREPSRILLLLPNGDGWQFRTNGRSVSLEESVYLGRGGTARRTRQIVISGTATRGETSTIKWAIHRLARSSEA